MLEIKGSGFRVKGLRIAALEAILSFEVGGALRFRFEAKQDRTTFASNLGPLTSNSRRLCLQPKTTLYLAP